jgi:5-carboxymethyl-2-hydroxymuconate isomerase
MPHLVIVYTPQLDAETDMGALCRKLADALQTVRDEAGKPVFPVAGTRVLAYPAAHHAVADGRQDCAFAYFNLRVGQGRSAAARQRAGEVLTETARAHLAPLLETRPLGLTLQIDEGHEAFDAKFGNLHALFAKP